MKPVSRFVVALWEKTARKQKLTTLELLVFYSLCFLEILYRAGFSTVFFFRIFFQKQHQFFGHVISVGNLSVGGTGKSVFVQFLVQQLTEKRCAIISRGYGRQSDDGNKSFLVSDGKHIIGNARLSGDEPLMLAKNLHIPVVVGSNRVESLKLLLSCMRHLEQEIDLVVLDDAYQNQAIKKNVEILLLDARHPFENGHCLPAGRLREKDISRADLIILTHADAVSLQELWRVKHEYLSSFNPQKIYSGRHALVGLFDANNKEVFCDIFEGKQVAACAGVGSFSNFLSSVQQLGVAVSASIEYGDHHDYTKKDIQDIVNKSREQGCCGIITTEKDWCKIAPLLIADTSLATIPWYILKIGFEFLSQQEYSSCMKLLRSRL